MSAARWTEPPEVVGIESLTLDEDLFPREGVDEETVAEYAEAMQEEGANFPPVHVIRDQKGGALLLVDGWHRVAAARRVGFTSLYARVRPGFWIDAAEAAAASNLRHGRRRTNADKRKAVAVLMAQPKWMRASDAAIARHCMVDDHLVAAVRAGRNINGLRLSSGTRGYEQPIENIEGDFSPPPERRIVQRGGTEYPITMPRQREPIRGRPESPKAPRIEEDSTIRQVFEAERSPASAYAACRAKTLARSRQKWAGDVLLRTTIKRRGA